MPSSEDVIRNPRLCVGIEDKGFGALHCLGCVAGAERIADLERQLADTAKDREATDRLRGIAEKEWGIYRRLFNATEERLRRVREALAAAHSLFEQGVRNMVLVEEALRNIEEPKP